MTVSSNVELAIRFVNYMVEGDFDKPVQMLSEDVKILGASGATYGKKEVEAYYQNFENPFKDAEMVVQDYYVCGDVVVLVGMMSGFLVEEYLGIAPFKKRYRLPVVNIVEFKDGNVVAWKGYMNLKIL